MSQPLGQPCGGEGDDANRAPSQNEQLRRILGFKVPVWQAVIAGGLGAAITGLVVLAATHKSAVTQNGIAYVNGYILGVTDNVIDKLLDGYL